MDKETIERQLIPRLKYLGMLLFCFSLIAVSYSFLPQDPEEAMMMEEDALFPEFIEPPPLNMYMVAVIFAIVGSTCLVISWRKKNANLDS